MGTERGSIRWGDLAFLAPIAVGVVCLGSYATYRWKNRYPEGEDRPTNPTPTFPVTIDETQAPLPLLETAEVFITPTLTPTDVIKESGEQRKCFLIDGNHPTAWSAWRQLGQPPEVIFKNLSGPDATGGSVKVKAPGRLPRLVHPGGDEICAPKGFSPKSSMPAPGSYAGFGIGS